MKKLLSTLLAATALTIAGYSQPTNYTTVPEFLGNSYNFLIGEGMTNLTVTTYGTYTPSIKEWGAGLMLTRNIPIGGGLAAGVGMGVDYYARNFYAISGDVSLQARIRPLVGWSGGNTNSFWSKIELTPFTFVGVGTPFGGGAENTSNIETIEAAGAALYLAKVAGGRLSVSGIYGTRQGLGDASGNFYGGGLNLHWDF